MGKVFRIYVEKMPQFAVEAKNVLSEMFLWFFKMLQIPQW